MRASEATRAPRGLDRAHDGLWRVLLAPLLVVTLVAGCGGDDDAPAESTDRAARPPAGWQTVRNAAVGLTASAPKRWTARTKGSRTLIRSPDRLVAIALVADRSRAGRDTPPADYVQQILRALPGFEGDASPMVRRVTGSPYRSARLRARGTVSTSDRPQRIEIAAFHRSGLVTYSALAFRNARVRSRTDDRTVARVLASLRAQPPG